MIEGFVTGDVAVVARLNRVGAAFPKELKTGIGRLALMLQRNVKKDKLSGQVLGVRTGRLRRSIAEVVEVSGDKVTGIVSTAVPYGAGWELGWPGGGGSPKASLKAGKAKFSAAASGTAFKNGTPKERSFLRSALADLAGSGKIMAELEAVSARATSA